MTSDPQTARENDLKAVYGCLITDVLKDGPADRAGVKAGDIVLEVNGKKVRDHIAFYNLIYFHRPGEMITLKILRDGKEIELTVSVSTRAAQAEKGWEMGGPEAVDNAYGAELREENRNGRSYVVIESVEEGSVASRLSLREGDVVIQINGQEINSTQAFKKAMDEAVKADRFKIRILRNGMTFMLEVEGLNVEENGEPDMF
ncbi:MAG: PDZ domain-containing protein [Planctomycetota bacterium]|nr:PDZ domain-containing protein [Planctomycetota bacterium]